MQALIRSSRPARALLTRISVKNSTSDFKDKETASERDYVNKTERDQLRSLLSKLDEKADPKGKVSRTALHLIFENHKLTLTPALETDLRAWKNDGHFAPRYID